MAKSTITLANGTTVTIEGSPEEVAKLLSLYGEVPTGTNDIKPKGKVSGSKKQKTSGNDAEEKIGVLALVNATKDAEDFDKIEQVILDGASQVDRVLLPLFVLAREFVGDQSLSSNDIYNYLKEFGINMALPNISKTLSTSAIKYVMASSTRKQGMSTPYRISRKGRQYVEQILTK